MVVVTVVMTSVTDVTGAAAMTVTDATGAAAKNVTGVTGVVTKSVMAVTGVAGKSAMAANGVAAKSVTVATGAATVNTMAIRVHITAITNIKNRQHKVYGSVHFYTPIFPARIYTPKTP